MDLRVRIGNDFDMTISKGDDTSVVMTLAVDAFFGCKATRS